MRSTCQHEVSPYVLPWPCLLQPTLAILFGSSATAIPVRGKEGCNPQGYGSKAVAAMRLTMSMLSPRLQDVVSTRIEHKATVREVIEGGEE